MMMTVRVTIVTKRTEMLSVCGHEAYLADHCMVFKPKQFLITVHSVTLSTDSLPASCSMYSFNFLSWLQVQNRFVTTVSSMLLTVDFKPINYPSMKNHNFIWSLIIQMNIKLSHFQKIEGLLKLKAYF